LTRADELRQIVANKADSLEPPLRQKFVSALQGATNTSVFEEQKTVKKVAERATKMNLADVTDYTGVAVEVANSRRLPITN
jgi:hypothetical protein